MEERLKDAQHVSWGWTGGVQGVQSMIHLDRYKGGTAQLNNKQHLLSPHYVSGSLWYMLSVQIISFMSHKDPME